MNEAGGQGRFGAREYPGISSSSVTRRDQNGAQEEELFAGQMT